MMLFGVWSRQHGSRDLLGDAVTERVLPRASRGSIRQSGDQRGLTERHAGPEQGEHAVLRHELDGAGADDAQVLDRFCALREDGRAGEEELDLR